MDATSNVRLITGPARRPDPGSSDEPNLLIRSHVRPVGRHPVEGLTQVERPAGSVPSRWCPTSWVHDGYKHLVRAGGTLQAQFDVERLGPVSGAVFGDAIAALEPQATGNLRWDRIGCLESYDAAPAGPVAVVLQRDVAGAALRDDLVIQLHRLPVVIEQELHELVGLGALALDPLDLTITGPDARVVVAIEDAHRGTDDRTDRQQRTRQGAEGNHKQLQAGLAREEPLPRGLFALALRRVLALGHVHGTTLPRHPLELWPQAR